MFDENTATLTETGKKILDAMATVVSKTPNNVAIHGHTGVASGASANPQYSSWELSADRANAARRFLVTTQLEPDRVMQVIGEADRQLLVPQEPTSPRNQRITIMVLRGSYFRDNRKNIVPTTRSILSVPEVKRKEDAEQH
jgi:chemotaxis protein MotB